MACVNFVESTWLLVPINHYIPKKYILYMINLLYKKYVINILYRLFFTYIKACPFPIYQEQVLNNIMTILYLVITLYVNLY